MANSIVLIGGTDKSIQSSAARFGRTPLTGVFDNWTTIRIGFLAQIADSGASLGATPRWAIGLCRGVTNIPGDATVTHACGMISNDPTWTRSTALVRYTINPYPFTYVNTTLSIGLTTIAISTTLRTTNYCSYFLTITKGSPNYTFAYFGPSGSAGADMTVAQFDTQFVAAVPAATNHANFTARTYAVDEATNGTFDSMFWWWNQITPVWTIKKLAMVKLA